MTHIYKLMTTALMVAATTGAIAQTYCVPPPFTTGPFTGIVKVELGTLNNPTAYDDGISDYTSTVAAPELVAGQTYTVKVTTEHNIQNQGFSDKLNTRVWIDWNQDGDFIDAGEEVLTSNSADPGLVTAEFTVPAGAVNGITRMRVYEDMPFVDGHDEPTPCGYLNSSNFVGHHGEAEDYNIEVTGGSTVGVAELTSNDIALNLYPNPASGTTTVNFTLASSQTVNIAVYDLQGKMLKHVATLTNVIGEQKVSVNLAELEKGVYLIKVDGENTNAVKKLLVN